MKVRPKGTILQTIVLLLTFLLLGCTGRKSGVGKTVSLSVRGNPAAFFVIQQVNRPPMLKRQVSLRLDMEGRLVDEDGPLADPIFVSCMSPVEVLITMEGAVRMRSRGKADETSIGQIHLVVLDRDTNAHSSEATVTPVYFRVEEGMRIVSVSQVPAH